MHLILPDCQAFYKHLGDNSIEEYIGCYNVATLDFSS